MERTGGLYDPATEHDACGVAFLADLDGRPRREIVHWTLQALENLAHRGARGAEHETGDGAGILLTVADDFFRAATEPLAFDLPPPGDYAVGMVFLPIDAGDRARCELILERAAREAGLSVVGWRDVPTNPEVVGPTARSVMPVFRQIFLGRGETPPGDPFENRLYLARKIAVSLADKADLGQRRWFYIPSLSSRTIVYKGMLTAEQLRRFYPDLSDPRLACPLALAHSRFSTNTFPSWELAHPYRFLAHNGEINTLRGNLNWMRAREATFRSRHYTGEEMRKLLPVIRHGLSDSASLDHAVEILVRCGRSLPHAVTMLVPPAWEKDDTMPEAVRDFYRYHACLVEPWDGPALVAFTDGRTIGAALDRNGLRPGRYWVTEDRTIVFASEVGVLDIPPERIVAKGRLGPGRMLLVDPARGGLLDDAAIKEDLARTAPYGAWLRKHLVRITDLPKRPIPDDPLDEEARDRRAVAFGWTQDEAKFVLGPLVTEGHDPVGSMGDDIPPAVFSERPRLLFDYFKQSFAQVTNPPIDAIREALVTSMRTTIGPEGNLLEPTPEAARQVELPSAILTDDEMARFRALTEVETDFRARLLDTTFPASEGTAGFAAALDRLFAEASAAVADGVRFLILSDRAASRDRCALPSLLATAGVHHHLVRTGARTRVGLVVEAGDAREVHHLALLLGYGAGAVHPYLAYERIDHLLRTKRIPAMSHEEAVARYVHAVSEGIRKVMSKMGISTVRSYRGAQIFEAIGLDRDLVERFFTGTHSRIGGAGLEEIAEETLRRHRAAWEEPKVNPPVGGFFQVRKDGEPHGFDAEIVRNLQQAVREEDPEAYRRFAKAANERRIHLRHYLRMKPRRPVPIEEVEPAEAILKRFVTGAMSYGALSPEAHEALALGMNAIGAASNTGEGGEPAARFGTPSNAKIKQVASARFGVTIQYLAAAEELQIKIAQGAKPGEGGQLPGKKVYPWIAEVRHATPYVGLISPPPHHDIYSIEDLAQLIHDLKLSNPAARVSVKLVAQTGVGTVAAGVVKAGADGVWIAGGDGGTGAAPRTSIRHAGLPWEIGLSETQQVLLLNRLRDRVTLGCDGGLKTGRDVVVAALLGAETFGFGTAALVALGCIMARVCHLNTCPTGVATQDPRLRERFAGKPEHLARYLRFVAEEVREILAALGARTLAEIVGRVDLLEPDRAAFPWKAKRVDFTELLHRPAESARTPARKVRDQVHPAGDSLDAELVVLAQDAIHEGEKVRFARPIRNTDRSVGAMLANAVVRAAGPAGLPEDTIRIRFRGSAGQSFGAFLPPGVTFLLEGDANDYLGKGLSGGKIVVVPPRRARFAAAENVVAGNVLLYGATGGRCYLLGRVGERFAVRNSGTTAVVEGTGDHACEYMTGGVVVILGPTGRNFGAGMTGGVAYVLDEAGDLARRIHPAGLECAPLPEEDAEALRAILADYWSETESPRAAAVLEDWEGYAPRFVKVVSREWREVTERLAREAREAASKG